MSWTGVSESINFPAEELKILEKWKRENTFKKSLELSKGRPNYSFLDGPPFATGLPHYGHILAGTIKDIVTRWAHQNGYNVERRFGWDTHGLPVEFEVDKMLDIKGPQDVIKMGIAKYNKECRKIVMRYSLSWENVVNRIGRWIDFENDYKTLYPWYMESVWWCFSQLCKKGLVYRGVKVMPFSTSCCTPLSNFEAGQNYKDVIDPAVIVGFQLDDDPTVQMAAWTTTPWTLPSNLCIAIHPDFDYVTLLDKKTERKHIILEERISELYKSNDFYEILDRFKGKVLEGKTYRPLFPYFQDLKEKLGVFRVITAQFVTLDQGTGVVHQAPYFGEIDYQTCLENGLISKEMKPVCPVDICGRFTDEVSDFKGMYVKDADKHICKYLRDHGNLIKQSEIKHSYPYCWRSDTPLLYMAVPSWFIRVEAIIPHLLANNEKTHWVPSFVKNKRFANWLKDARDWAVSRNRFWGTPINIWVSDDMEEIVCPESIAELEALSGKKIHDLHRENVDNITIPSKTGRGELHRISEVFDCWFESGSMPYAQKHYPFENRKEFEETFPADFIAEGIDQTRGWFYTLLVISTAIFNKPPFKNLICNGLILASDCSKMSKRKKNYPDPMEIVSTYGADALRLYLINSPVVRGENLRFREEGIKDALKDVLLPWYNAYRFFAQNVALYMHEASKAFTLSDAKSSNVMDRWITSFTNSLVDFVVKEMKLYRLHAVVSPLMKFFDTLTNCYIRLNRKRMKGEDGESDRLKSLTTLAHVLIITVKLMAPFAPFFCEMLWQNLRQLVDNSGESVHFEYIPQPRLDLIDESVERRVAAMRSVVDLVRVLRERKSIPVKYPLREMIVINRDGQFLDDVKSLEKYILSELNIRQLVVSQDKEKYGVQLKAEPNFRNLGHRLKGDQKTVVNYLRNCATEDELSLFVQNGSICVLGHELGPDDLTISYTSSGSDSTNRNYETISDSQTVAMVDISEEDSLLDDGLAREVTSRIQKLRKMAKLISSDSAVAFCSVTPEDHRLHKILETHRDYIENATGTTVKIGLCADGSRFNSSSAVKGAQIEVHLIVRDMKPSATFHHNEKSHQVFLDHESGSIHYSRLIYELRELFSLWSKPRILLSIVPPPDQSVLSSDFNLLHLNNKSVFIVE